MPIDKFSLPRAALLLALGCAAFTTTAFTTMARADEASLERAAQAQPEAPKADNGVVTFNPATYIATGAPRSLRMQLPLATARQKPRRSTAG